MKFFGEMCALFHCKLCEKLSSLRQLVMPVYIENFLANMRFIVLQNVKNLSKYVLKYAAYVRAYAACVAYM